MSHAVNDDIMESINATIDWASDLGESWVATTTGRILDNQRDELLSVVKSGDLELAKVLAVNLFKTCTYAQKELDENDG